MSGAARGERSDARRSNGYTVIELLVTIAVLAIVTAIAAPGLAEIVARNRLAAQANELVGALNYARSEAVTRGQAVALCPASAPYTACADTGDWTDGWVVFTDAGTANAIDASTDVIRVFDALRAGSRLDAGATHVVRYLSTGFLDADAGPFTLRAGQCSGMRVRTISLSPQGRPFLSVGSC